MQRLDYFIRKAAFSILTALGVLIFNFLLFRIIPGDPYSMIVQLPRIAQRRGPETANNTDLTNPSGLTSKRFQKNRQSAAGMESQFFLIYFSNFARAISAVVSAASSGGRVEMGNRLGPTVVLISSVN